MSPIDRHEEIAGQGRLALDPFLDVHPVRVLDRERDLIVGFALLLPDADQRGVGLRRLRRRKRMYRDDHAGRQQQARDERQQEQEAKLHRRRCGSGMEGHGGDP
ncbi:MAG: hypothetical protein WDO13_03825 [Verrucomicrobiota bacterium]